MMDAAGPHRSGQAHTIRPTRESGVRRATAHPGGPPTPAREPGLSSPPPPPSTFFPGVENAPQIAPPPAAEEKLAAMGGTGLEPAPLAPKKTPISEKRQENGTESGTPKPDFDPDLAQIVAAWPDLPDDVKRKILHLVRSYRPTPEAPA